MSTRKKEIKVQNAIKEITKLMSQKYQIDISTYDLSFLEKLLKKRLLFVDSKSIENYIDYLSNNRKEAEHFFETLNITYSEFFRDPLTFAILEKIVFPKLIEEKSDIGEIRIWSCGCATGQEAYSIAFLVDKLYSKRTKPMQFRILATDISRNAIEIALGGTYKADAVENISLRMLKDYFICSGDSYTVIPKIKKMITFSTYDLLNSSSKYPPESIFGNFDVVFCSNLLYYYQSNIRQLMFKKLISSLGEKGYFVTSDVERGFVSSCDRLHNITPSVSIFIKAIGGVL